MGKTVCSIGHRNANITSETQTEIQNAIIDLIENKGVDTFLFGQRMDFEETIYDIVSTLRQKYSLTRIYYQLYYPDDEEFVAHCCPKYFEKCVYAEEQRNAGYATYIQRNKAMIRNSDYCLFFYDENYLPPRRVFAKRFVLDYQPKSGTALAYRFAVQQKKEIINFFRGKA